MVLSVRSVPYMVPTYSLTGDLLAYLNCGLQYRYHNRASLPPSKPVQLWFGQFIHGVMEEAYRVWATGDRALALPDWSDREILPIVDLIIRRLSARGLYFQRYQLLSIAVERAIASINVWGPYLFPLIAEAEVRLKGIRALPSGTTTIRQSDYYEVEGVVDVITSVQLSAALTPNPVVAALLSSLPAEEYEVVVDYKGMRRPSLQTSDDQSGAWEYQEWQVLTYAWLRDQQSGEAQVRSGILLYLNELEPGIEDMDRLYDEIFGQGQETTDLLPVDDDYSLLKDWPGYKRDWQRQSQTWEEQVREWWPQMRQREEGAPYPPFPRRPSMEPSLSLDYRFNRSWRIVNVAENRIDNSLSRFDQVVSAIEGSVASESAGNRITRVWRPNPRDETCTVCDFRRFCPAEGNRYRGAPTAP